MSQINSELLSLSDIIIYPIKSLMGVTLNQAKVELQGIKDDRLMMLVDDNNLFITQRKYPQLALINLSVIQSNIHLTINGRELLIINSDSFEDKFEPVKIWKDQCHAQMANDKINQWFSDYLNQAVKLVRYDHKQPRQSDQNYSSSHDIVSFADGFPLLVISDASLIELNRRLEYSVSMSQFRPNLTVKGGHAYQEDSWKKIKIGEVIFDAVKRCDRCILTTIDPKNGIKSSSRDPLKTLQSYRQENGKTYFGMNLIARNLGVISVADKIEILELSD